MFNPDRKDTHAASLVFYGYGQPELLPLLAVAVLGTYLFLILALHSRATWLPVGIAFNLALLAFFNYKFLFLNLASVGPTGVAAVDFLLKLPLPVGISFFVFHNISLLVDLTKQDRPPPSLWEVFLYIIFFPHLVSGRSPAPKCSCRRSCRRTLRTFPSSRPPSGSLSAFSSSCSWPTISTR